ncbi:MAG: hypothetical protein ABJQ23_02645 [Shimia thalassica]|uniref:hypothetical protein n=1 Tax=Shimia thalassica TaxID=1715693 RepID=UPI00329706EA
MSEHECIFFALDTLVFVWLGLWCLVLAILARLKARFPNHALWIVVFLFAAILGFGGAGALWLGKFESCRIV